MKNKNFFPVIPITEGGDPKKFSIIKRELEENLLRFSKDQGKFKEFYSHNILKLDYSKHLQHTVYFAL